MKTNSNIHLATADTCTGCAACVSVCPTGSISMKEDREGFLQPHIDTKTCIGCHKCEKTCSIITPIEVPIDFETQVYAAINKDEEVRMRSSSGGMFHILAKGTIEQSGVVFGARFNNQWEVMHNYTETIEGIEPFLRSKYVQSRIGDTFKQAKQFLDAGRQVLFVGTPCQIGGLKAYLKKEYDNLLTVDFICHGVPSPKVWREYIGGVRIKDEILDINFRDKHNGWKNFELSITAGTTRIYGTQRGNFYMKGFLNNIYLRKSCYDCLFKEIHRVSDITLADFWGIENVNPEIDDDRGLSAVFVHTNKGQNAVNLIQSKIQLWPQKICNVIAYNSAMTKSVPKSSKRSRFYFYKHFLPIGKLAFTIDKDWLWVRIIRKIKKIMG